ncbi:hypothetical protein BDV27DRAFT_138669 [Aspergillus caelatus]|uniref:Uncharacterized protein n=1 Tax=Aspergillus caelatus TaxID=61420 RepID=A0A5N6ZLW9_9EURO|nr:uncharacterized protein BDV27DRAFT_138669 [Aspergillus caelatus]KAE8357809.1 hypothetical protein BDV27DRAFT_138669 [Aspergillus caelatus]
MVSTQDSDSCNPGSIPGTTSYSLFAIHLTWLNVSISCSCMTRPRPVVRAALILLFFPSPVFLPM